MEYFALNSKEIQILLEQYDVTNALIQQVYQDDYEHLVFKIYKNREKRYFIINLSQYSHFYVAENYRRKNNNSLRFKELLQSKLKNGVIITIEYKKNDRSILFHVKRGENTYYLLILLWGHAANIYLCTPQWQILDAYYRKKNDISQRQIDRYRNLLIDSSIKVYSDLDQSRFPVQSSALHDTVAKFYQNKPLKEQSKYMNDNTSLSIQKKCLERYEKEYDSLMNSSLAVSIENREKEFFSQHFSSSEEYQYHYHQFHQDIGKLYARQKKEVERLFHLRTLIQKSQLQCNDKNQIDQAKLKSAHKKRFFLQFRSESYQILVGKSSEQSDMLLRYHARGLDYWIHIRADKGAHVIIKYQKERTPSADVIADACALAHYYSKKRQQHEVEMTFTQIKDLKKLKKSGLVEVQRGKTLFYVYDKDRIQRLLQDKLEER
ncbi:NFACT RNA binding domain-containing protein [Entomospira entomophila]|uniref:DUF814 domain-containing protein n=1 Tax=Entomospira entomophila TaxID=2719988 RepID=A0A968KSI3_9SPIO|nr:NFACT RNA binding domain-containing protein [Entomospira entomophilus]NIZ40382.1 DUF814 domain-containing protein [Entomospira entomophilus]WDI35941.1 NFACT RNA binding domain-containing protein [Entomospira entomophilus]